VEPPLPPPPPPPPRPPPPPSDRLLNRIGTVATITYTHEEDIGASAHGEVEVGGPGGGGGGANGGDAPNAAQRSRVWNRHSGQLVLTALGTGRFRILHRIDGDGEGGGGANDRLPGAPHMQHPRGYGDMVDIKLYVVEHLGEGGFGLPPAYLRGPCRFPRRAATAPLEMTSLHEEDYGADDDGGDAVSLPKSSCHSSTLRQLSTVGPLPPFAIGPVWPWRLCESIVTELLRDDAEQWEGLRKSLPACSGVVTATTTTTTIAAEETAAASSGGARHATAQEQGAQSEEDEMDTAAEEEEAEEVVDGRSSSDGRLRPTSGEDVPQGDDSGSSSERGEGEVITTSCCCRIGGGGRVGTSSGEKEGVNDAAEAPRESEEPEASSSSRGDAGDIAAERDSEILRDGIGEDDDSGDSDDSASSLSSPPRPYFDPARCDPPVFSHWLSANLPLPDLDRIDLLETRCPVQRLRFLLGKIVRQRSVDRPVRCKRCGAEVSSVGRMFTVGGAEGTTGAYVNAHGVVHQTITVRSVQREAVLCFGEPEVRDSWFPGYSWTIAHCSLCHSHLGWKFLPAVPRRRRRHRRGTFTDDDDENPSRPDVFWGLSGASVTTDESAAASPRRVYRGRFPLDWLALTFGHQAAARGAVGDEDESDSDD